MGFASLSKECGTTTAVTDCFSPLHFPTWQLATDDKRAGVSSWALNRPSFFSAQTNFFFFFLFCQLNADNTVAKRPGHPDGWNSHLPPQLYGVAEETALIRTLFSLFLSRRIANDCVVSFCVYLLSFLYFYDYLSCPFFFSVFYFRFIFSRESFQTEPRIQQLTWAPCLMTCCPSQSLEHTICFPSTLCLYIFTFRKKKDGRQRR